jgi:hypothetical protein
MSQEEEEAMASGQPKTRTLYSLFSKVPVSRRMISSAGEEAFQGLLSDFTGFTSDFNDRVALGQSKNARKESSESRPCIIGFGLPRLQGDFTIEMLYNT